MLTKEECLEALNALDDLANFTFNINREGKYYKTIYQLIKEHFDPQPYTFRELNKEMWVWDDKEKVCFQCNPMISTDMAQCVTYMSYWYNDGFEENRFYPLTKALQYQGKEDE